ncbi:Putative Zn-dependent protease, contains TPR repeats [hydrothermal vent metagenome]|uniref:Zn-dependent protease, contains TPR repeats n=1 Tax=hydrothermal vent metagenome TaxID=652676 RepID=A0A3B0RMM8_9ZZZZ
MGQVRDAEIEALMREFSDPIFEAAGLRPEDVRIYVINDPTMNAFVTGGQNMGLHTGIILTSNTPNELKGVIAHETGHMSGGHLARQSDAMKKAARPMILTMGLGILAAAAGEPRAAAALMASAQQFGTLTFFTHSRIQEAAADQAAANFMEATGQSGKGLIKFYQRFNYGEVMSGSKRYPYFRTHPLSSKRIDSLINEVGSAPHANAVDSPSDIFRFAMAKAKIIGFLNPQRIQRDYPDEDQSLPAKYARAIATYLDADTKQALQKIDELIKIEPENPYFNELYGQVLFESGRAKEAISYHQRAVDLAPKSPLLRLNLAQAMIATDTKENLELAYDHLQYVLRLEPDNSFAWYALSLLHEKAGNIGLAKLATAEQAYILHDYGRALGFAQRAKIDLRPNTPQWRRANDILLVIAADPRMQRSIKSGGH